MKGGGSLYKSLAAFALVLITGCSDRYQPIPAEGTWVITGTLIFADSGKPVANNKIELIRSQRACHFCEMRGVLVATVHSNSDGHFEIESNVPGTYNLVTTNPNNRICYGQAYLGYLKDRRVNVAVRVKENKCILIL
jgi:hypothetical protein